MSYSVNLLLLCVAIPAFAQISQPDPLFYPDMRARMGVYVHTTFTDPARLAWLLIDSANDTWSQSPHQWDRSAESYSYRVASAWGRRIVRNTVMLGFETALHEDSRYRRSNSTGLRKRAFFAIRHSVLSYTPNGSVEPAYGRIAAGAVSAAVSSTWHPQSITPDQILRGVGQAALDRAGNNLLTEFEPDLIAFGKKTWNGMFRK